MRAVRFTSGVISRCDDNSSVSSKADNTEDDTSMIKVDIDMFPTDDLHERQKNAGKGSVSEDGMLGYMEKAWTCQHLPK